MKVINLVLAGLFAVNVSYAQCDKPVSYLRQGQSANCTGYLFSEEKEKEIREMAAKYPVLVEMVSKQNELINTLNERVDLNQQLAANRKQQLETAETQNRLENIIYFSLGIVLGLAVTKINR